MAVGNLTYDSGIPATPSDTVNDPAGPFVAFYVWVTGTVSFIDQAGHSSGTSGALTAGTLVRVKGVRINATGTSASVLLCYAPA